MNRLIKIKELSGYRFFQNFKWDENNCALFSKYNIIYGWNGTGKTTLCDFFKEIEKGELSEAETKISLLFENTETKAHETITHNKLNTIPYEFRVYHNQYIQETISEVDKVKHIFAVGSEQKERIDELKSLKEKLKTEKATLASLSREMTTMESAFEQLKSSKASEVKNAAKYPSSYNKNKFYDAFKKLSAPCILSEQDLQQATTDITAEKKDEILWSKIDFIQPSVRDVIIAILNDTPTNIIIETFKNNASLNQWVEQGLSIHESQNEKACLFCGNIISEQRLEILRLHFNQSYKELSNKIDDTINLLQSHSQKFETTKVTLPQIGLFYTEYKDAVEKLSDTISSLSTANSITLKAIIEILNNKKADMINQSYVQQFQTLLESFIFDYSPFSQLHDIIDSHNQKTTNFQTSITLAQQKIEKHMLSLFIADITDSEKSICLKKEEVDKQEQILENLKSQIDKLDKQVRNSQISAESMNKDIAFIMGRNELVFENKPLGYQITRKGKIAKNLSNGELNAIALIYFFNTLASVDSNLQNTIIILDDPISSFDSNFYYNAISYIRDKTNNAGQVFVFTHKFSLLKDYTLMYKGDANKYMMERICDLPVLHNEDDLVGKFHDEYAFLFKQVYSFAKSKDTDKQYNYLLYPNIARRLLEGFLTFKVPTNDTLIDKVLKLELNEDTASGRAMLRLLNNYSHLRVIKDNSSIDDTSTVLILPDTLNHLLNFIETHDKLHFSMMVQQCDPYAVYEDAQSVTLKRTIKLYSLPVSAGSGIPMLDSDTPYDEIEVENDDCSYAVRISGDSMEPDFPNESIVLVKDGEEVPHTHIGIFFYDGEVYCKKRIDTPTETLLVSINKKYPPIKIQDDFSFKTFGKVLGIL